MAAAGRKSKWKGNSALARVTIKREAPTTLKLTLLNGERGVKCPPKLQIRWVPARGEIHVWTLAKAPAGSV